MANEIEGTPGIIEDAIYTRDGIEPIPMKARIIPKEWLPPDYVYVKFTHEGRDYEGKVYPVKREVKHVLS